MLYSEWCFKSYILLKCLINLFLVNVGTSVFLTKVSGIFKCREVPTNACEITSKIFQNYSKNASEKGGHSKVGSYYFKSLCHTSVPTFLPFMLITLVKPWYLLFCAISYYLQFLDGLYYIWHYWLLGMLWWNIFLRWYK